MQSQLEQLPEEIAQLGGAFSLLRAEIGKAVIGQEAVIEAVLAALLAGGHCLLQGVPGLAKTLLVQSLGQALALDFRRVQFTPDLMPGDITGSDILDEEPGSGRRELRFIPGPAAEDAGGAAGGDAGASGLKPRCSQSAAAPLLRAGDAESDRAGGDLSAAGGAA